MTPQDWKRHDDRILKFHNEHPFLFDLFVVLGVALLFAIAEAVVYVLQGFFS